MLSSEDTDKAVDGELDGPGSEKTEGIEAGGCREDCPGAVGTVIG